MAAAAGIASGSALWVAPAFGAAGLDTMWQFYNSPFYIRVFLGLPRQRRHRECRLSLASRREPSWVCQTE
jgi:hypothetical protein